MDYAGIGLAASVGLESLTVYRRPRVAILSTGDEIVEIGAQPGPHQIRNSNSYSLAAQVEAAGGRAEILSIARDERSHLRMLIEQGLQSDLLLLSGGVSMGKYDSGRAGARGVRRGFLLHGSADPAGPTHRFRPRARAVLLRAARKSDLDHGDVRTVREDHARGFSGDDVAATAISPCPPEDRTARSRPGLKRFLPGFLSGEFERVEVKLAGWHGSGDVAAMGRSNCYIVIPEDRTKFNAGEWVAVVMR